MPDVSTRQHASVVCLESSVSQASMSDVTTTARVGRMSDSRSRIRSPRRVVNGRKNGLLTDNNETVARGRERTALDPQYFPSPVDLRRVRGGGNENQVVDPRFPRTTYSVQQTRGAEVGRSPRVFR